MHKAHQSVTIVSCGYVVNGATRTRADNLFASIELDRTAADAALRFLDETVERTTYRQIGRFLVYHTTALPPMQHATIAFCTSPPELRAASRLEGKVRRSGPDLEWMVKVGRQLYAGPVLRRGSLLAARLALAGREDAGPLFRQLCDVDPRIAADVLNVMDEASPLVRIPALLGHDDLAYALASDDRVLRGAAILTLPGERRVGCFVSTRSPHRGVRR